MSDTKSTWRRRVARWRTSGQTADEFAAARGFKGVIRAPTPVVTRGSVIVDVPGARARVTVEAGVERATLDAVFGALGIGGAL